MHVMFVSVTCDWNIWYLFALQDVYFFLLLKSVFSLSFLFQHKSYSMATPFLSFRPKLHGRRKVLSMDIKKDEVISPIEHLLLVFLY